MLKIFQEIPTHSPWGVCGVLGLNSGEELPAASINVGTIGVVGNDLLGLLSDRLSTPESFDTRRGSTLASDMRLGSVCGLLGEMLIRS